jgi:hypothetical protein
MTKLNYIEFENPPMTYSIIPHAHCMIYKPKKELIRYNLSNSDYCRLPHVDYELLGRVLEAKKIKLNNN